MPARQYYPTGQIVHSELDFNPVEVEKVPAGQAKDYAVELPSGQ